MKKIVLIALATILSTGINFAQDAKTTRKHGTEKTGDNQNKQMRRMKKDSATGMHMSKRDSVSGPRHQEHMGKHDSMGKKGPMKKDGTPDRRYKGNK